MLPIPKRLCVKAVGGVCACPHHRAIAQDNGDAEPTLRLTLRTVCRDNSTRDRDLFMTVH